MIFATQNWFLLALVAPCLWALVAIIDTYTVHSVYEDEYDGAVISGVFQSLPWILVPLGIVQFTFPGIEIAVVALLAGGFFLLSFFCYFKALFVSNDSTLMEIIWNLNILVVPFFAWLLIGEVLVSAHYTGIAVAFLGIILFNFDRQTKEIGYYKILLPMLGAVVSMSLGMVISKQAYELSSDFWSVFLLFSIGATIATFLILAIGRRNPFLKAKKIASLSRKYFLLFIIAEGFSVIATLTSQRAISIAPAVSVVAVIESLAPVFVMIFSLILVTVFRNSGRIDLRSYHNQFSNAGIKMLALSLISVGIYLIS
ncbi:MAG: hypothetical protein WAT84_05095 [Candidatus Moraniibacteriota bacterium]